MKLPEKLAEKGLDMNLKNITDRLRVAGIVPTADGDGPPDVDLAMGEGNPLTFIGVCRRLYVPNTRGARHGDNPG